MGVPFDHPLEPPLVSRFLCGIVIIVRPNTCLSLSAHQIRNAYYVIPLHRRIEMAECTVIMQRIRRWHIMTLDDLTVANSSSQSNKSQNFYTSPQYLMLIYGIQERSSVLKSLGWMIGIPG